MEKGTHYTTKISNSQHNESMSEMQWKSHPQTLSDAKRDAIFYRMPKRILKTESQRSEDRKGHIWHTRVGLQGELLWPVGLTALPVTGSK